ncbi:hypothetical protein ACFWN7_11410 [Agromyces sp. NPDC058484]|uniref:hypothetical protein n=1 Tax=Agromyces sp. NPDC058484 TaxID=3346524 RepID=UPI003657B6BE
MTRREPGLAWEVRGLWVAAVYAAAARRCGCPEHEPHNLLELRLVELLEQHHLVDAVQELGAHGLGAGPHSGRISEATRRHSLEVVSDIRDLFRIEDAPEADPSAAMLAESDLATIDCRFDVTSGVRILPLRSIWGSPLPPSRW